MQRWLTKKAGWIAAAAVVLAALPFVLTAGGEEIVFEDAERQTRQFMEWERSIRLTPRQEAVKKAALEPLPAPCCSDNSAYTCCCQCNISRTIWGLSNYLIAEQDAGASEVRSKAAEWIAFVNPDGYSGDTCYRRRGCQRAFRHNGCGGMNPSHVVF